MDDTDDVIKGTASDSSDSHAKCSQCNYPPIGVLL